MKSFKRITLLLLLSLTVASNCFAVTKTKEEQETKDNNKIVYEYYEVNEKEESEFINSIQNKINIEEKEYLISNIEKSGGNKTYTKDISDVKEVVLNTNKLEDILKQIPITIDYNQDEYIGVYNLDVNSIKIDSIYNGYKEVKVEETIEYKDLEKNDLSYINKQILKDGIKLDLLNVKWLDQTTKNIGINTETDKYTANCYYAGIKRVDNPLTYKITANYRGMANKLEEIPYTYKIKYETNIEENNTNIIPLVIGTGGIFFVLLIYFNLNNAKLYILKDEKYKLLKKFYIKKDKVDITKVTRKYNNAEYQLVLSKRLIKKLNNKLIYINKDNRKIARLIRIDNGIEINFKF